MKLLLHYLKAYRLILFRQHACPRGALLWAYTRLLVQAHWAGKRGSRHSGTQSILLFGKRLYFTSYIFLLYQFEEIFVLDCYRAKTAGEKRFIVDGGSHIGVSVLFFITAYPTASVLAFEPDPQAFHLLQLFVQQNKLHQVQLVNAALAATAGTVSFYAHEELGRLDAGTFTASAQTVALTVPTVQLSTYLTQPVDVLKLDIEGAEVPVIAELVASQKISDIGELVLEFHPAINGEPAPFLSLLEQEGFQATSTTSADLYENTTDYLLHFTRR